LTLTTLTGPRRPSFFDGTFPPLFLRSFLPPWRRRQETPLFFPPHFLSRIESPFSSGITALPPWILSPFRSISRCFGDPSPRMHIFLPRPSHGFLYQRAIFFLHIGAFFFPPLQRRFVPSLWRNVKTATSLWRNLNFPLGCPLSRKDAPPLANTFHFTLIDYSFFISIPPSPSPSFRIAFPPSAVFFFLLLNGPPPLAEEREPSLHRGPLSCPPLPLEDLFRDAQGQFPPQDGMVPDSDANSSFLFLSLKDSLPERSSIRISSLFL